MRVFQCILLCALLSFVSVDAFGTCTDDTDCPDNAECGSGCECKAGFDEFDLSEATADGNKVTVCLDLGSCSPLDNDVSDCVNGQCTVYMDQYGSYEAVCKCKEGFYGEKCDKPMPPTMTTSSTTPGTTTKKPGIGPIIPIIGGGVALVVLLAAGAAALASSSG